VSKNKILIIFPIIFATVLVCRKFNQNELLGSWISTDKVGYDGIC